MKKTIHYYITGLAIFILIFGFFIVLAMFADDSKLSFNCAINNMEYRNVYPINKNDAI